MKKKFFAVLIAILVLPATALTAQQAQGFSFMSFNFGYGAIIEVDDPDLDVMSSFGVNFRVAGPMIVGVSVHSLGSYSSGLLRVMFDVTPNVRPVLSFGQLDDGAGTSAVTGLGFQIIPFRQTVGGLTTEFKLVTEYLFSPSVGIDEGRFHFGLMIGIGF